MRASSFLVATVVCVALLCCTVSAVAGARAHRRPAAIIDSSNIDAAFAEANNKNNANATDELESWRQSKGLPQVGSPDSGVYGVDVSQSYGASTFSCLRQRGFSFAIVRVWESVCAVDRNGAATISAAWAGGMSHVDAYLFPSYGCRLSAAAQVTAAINSLSGHKFGTLWFDIETQGSGWSGNTANNHAWLSEGVAQAVKLIGASRVGIYANKNSWEVVMGGAGGFSSYPIWYPHYDAEPSFADWSSFGGWSRPAIKQFNDAPEVCGASIDHSWYP